ncbi:hypothetical protein AVEN_51722-1 [Araneus ventricosus]|uniref:Uncharacterized protein n=1 Tax=Araneus ventricosus TaxID=182803 RepID=A0A4Y2GHT8_ARAVE|nr:hypothetical protein AVEN_51722-1 [Araneus ventricosus]
MFVREEIEALSQKRNPQNVMVSYQSRAGVCVLKLEGGIGAVALRGWQRPVVWIGASLPLIGAFLGEPERYAYNLQSGGIASKVTYHTNGLIHHPWLNHDQQLKGNSHEQANADRNDRLDIHPNGRVGEKLVWIES